MSELTLEDWDIDFGTRTGTFYFAWTETSQIRVDVVIEYDVDCELKHFNGRDYEECTPIAEVASYKATLEYIHPRSGDVMSTEDSDIDWEDYDSMLGVIRSEYTDYLKGCEDDI